MIYQTVPIDVARAVVAEHEKTRLEAIDQMIMLMQSELEAYPTPHRYSDGLFQAIRLLREYR